MLTERRRSRTYPAVGYTTSPVLKTGWATGPVPLRCERSGAKKTDKGESNATHDGLELIVCGKAWRFQANNAQLGCLIHSSIE